MKDPALSDSRDVGPVVSVKSPVSMGKIVSDVEFDVCSGIWEAVLVGWGVDLLVPPRRVALVKRRVVGD